MSVLDTFRLDGRVALVTGTGSGLGRAIARALSEAGAAVGCLDVQGDAARETAAAIAAAGGRSVAVTADISRAAEAEAATGMVTSALGPVDILFNVAGVSAAGKRLHELPPEEWRRRLSINLDGVFFMSRAALPGMLERGWGRIVNVASIWGQLGSRLHPITEYAAAKGAIINLTREMACQYAARGVLVNAIAPGFFRTNLTAKHATQEWADFAAATAPIGRHAMPEEITGLAVFLAAPCSSYMTGQTVFIDGGFSCH